MSSWIAWFSAQHFCLDLVTRPWSGNVWQLGLRSNDRWQWSVFPRSECWRQYYDVLILQQHSQHYSCVLLLFWTGCSTISGSRHSHCHSVHSLGAGRRLPELPNGKSRRESLETGTCPFSLQGSAVVPVMSCQQVVEREPEREEGHAREGNPCHRGPGWNRGSKHLC